MLFNEPKLLKSYAGVRVTNGTLSFSALQRAEIAEIVAEHRYGDWSAGFSALQRAEIAEMCGAGSAVWCWLDGFSALQRAEIAEMYW